MPKQFVELTMPVPYGHLAMKAWGSPEGTQTILALHGWQDNAGTFDAIIPMIPDSFYVIALDFPGHGMSSHLPPGSPYHDIVFIMEIKRLVEYFKLENFIILGHSMGAALGLFFASIFPKIVDTIIAIDMIKPLSFPAEELAKRTSDGIKLFLNLDEKINSKPPVYDHKTAIQKLIEAHSVYGVITPEGAECLLKRGTKQIEDGKEQLYFSRDNRLKAILFCRMDSTALMSYLQHIQCKLCIIKATNGIKLDSDEIVEKYIQLYKTKCKKFKYIQVEGGHHVHLCQPEVVAPFINQFLNNQLTNGTNGFIN